MHLTNLFFLKFWSFEFSIDSSVSKLQIKGALCSFGEETEKDNTYNIYVIDMKYSFYSISFWYSPK